MTVAEGLLGAALVFGPLAFGAVEPWSLAGLSALVFGAMFVCALRVRPRLSHPMYRFMLPSVVALLALGAIQRANPVSILEPASWWPHTVSGYFTERALMLWALYACVLWTVPQALEGTKSVSRLLGVLLAVGALVAVIGIIQRADGDNQHIYGLRAAPSPLDPFGPYYNRDHAGNLLVMASIGGFGLLLDGFKPDSNRDRFEAGARGMLILFGMGLCLAGVILSRSVGALASLMGGSLVFIFGTAPRKVKGALILTLLLAPVLVARSPLAKTVANGVTRPLSEKLTVPHLKEALRERLLVHQGGWRIVRDYSWFGIGLGAFQQAYYPYQGEVRGIFEHAHSDWLELLVQVGVPGAAGLGLGLFSFLIFCARRSWPLPSLACGVFGAVAAFLIHSLFDFPFQTPANAIVFLALLSSLAVVAGSIERLPVNKPNLALAALAFALFALQIPQAVGSGYHLSGRISDALTFDERPRYHYQLARQEADMNPRAALAHLDAALREDPAHPNYQALRGHILDRLKGASP